jgi:hypothetical protein
MGTLYTIVHFYKSSNHPRGRKGFKYDQLLPMAQLTVYTQTVVISHWKERKERSAILGTDCA